MKTLGILLGASVLLNVALLARGSVSAPEPSRRPAPPPAVRRADVPAPAAADVEELALLRSPVREFEAEKAARSESVAVPDRMAGFREKLARVFKLMKNPKAQMNATPEAQLEITEVSMEIQRAKILRWRDPKAYVETLRTVLEQLAAEAKTPLRQDQQDGIGRTLEEYEKTLGGFADKDAFARYLGEVGPEADLVQRLRSCITPELENKIQMFGGLSPSAASPAPWVDRTQAENQMVMMWTNAYGLEDGQKVAVAAAARIYIDAAADLNAQMGRDATPGRESPEWRRRTAQILVDTLSSLEHSLTPEQRERLRQRRPVELHLYDAVAAQRWAR